MQPGHGRHSRGHHWPSVLRSPSARGGDPAIPAGLAQKDENAFVHAPCIGAAHARGGGQAPRRRLHDPRHNDHGTDKQGKEGIRTAQGAPAVAPLAQSLVSPTGAVASLRTPRTRCSRSPPRSVKTRSVAPAAPSFARLSSLLEGAAPRAYPPVDLTRGAIAARLCIRVGYFI